MPEGLVIPRAKQQRASKQASLRATCELMDRQLELHGLASVKEEKQGETALYFPGFPLGF